MRDDARTLPLRLSVTCTMHVPFAGCPLSAKGSGNEGVRALSRRAGAIAGTREAKDALLEHPTAVAINTVAAGHSSDPRISVIAAL